MTGFMTGSPWEATRVIFRLGYLCARISGKPVPSTFDEIHDILDEIGLDCRKKKISEIQTLIDDYIKQHGDGATTLKL